MVPGIVGRDLLHDAFICVFCISGITSPRLSTCTGALTTRLWQRQFDIILTSFQ